MLLSRAAAADARSPAPVSNGRAHTPAILKEEHRVRRRSPDRHRFARFDAMRIWSSAHLNVSPSQHLNTRSSCVSLSSLACSQLLSASREALCT